VTRFTAVVAEVDSLTILKVDPKNLLVSAGAVASGVRATRARGVHPAEVLPLGHDVALKNLLHILTPPLCVGFSSIH
jgi:hypothetical protein